MYRYSRSTCINSLADTVPHAHQTAATEARAQPRVTVAGRPVRRVMRLLLLAAALAVAMHQLASPALAVPSPPRQAAGEQAEPPEVSSTAAANADPKPIPDEKRGKDQSDRTPTMPAQKEQYGEEHDEEENEIESLAESEDEEEPLAEADEPIADRGFFGQLLAGVVGKKREEEARERAMQKAKYFDVDAKEVSEAEAFAKAPAKMVEKWEGEDSQITMSFAYTVAYAAIQAMRVSGRDAGADELSADDKPVTKLTVHAIGAAKYREAHLIDTFGAARG
jgi:hypothetical protein